MKILIHKEVPSQLLEAAREMCEQIDIKQMIFDANITGLNGKLGMFNPNTGAILIDIGICMKNVRWMELGMSYIPNVWCNMLHTVFHEGAHASHFMAEPEHFEIANTFLYSRIRKLYYTDDGTVWANMFIGTDFCFGCDNPETANYGDYEIANSPMNTKWVKHWWSDNYTIIFNANVIISRIVDVEFSSEEQKNINIAEAKFFRAFAYRSLVYLYGGVPIVLEETTIPKRDYFRATRE